jgi:hypothetical protein
MAIIDIQFTDADLQELHRTNPLAAQALQNIALKRMVVERDARLAELRNGHEKTPVPALSETDAS